MKKVCFLFIIFLAFVLESRLTFLGTAPNLTAVIAYYFGLKNGETKGMLFGSLIGLTEDSICGTMLGANLLGNGLVGFFASLMSGSFFRWTPLLGLIGISLLTALDNTVVFLSRSIFDSVPTSVHDALSITIVSSAINSVFGIFLRPKSEQ